MKYKKESTSVCVCVFKKDGKTPCAFDVGNPRAQGLPTVC